MNLESRMIASEDRGPQILTYGKSVNAEPPDIRNWFPSYTYESFVLDTYDDAFKGSAFKERYCDGGDGFVVDEKKKREKEGNLDECRRNGDIDDKKEDQSLRMMPDSMHSPSPLSEPPPIKNWFSSYVYESPVLDTLDDLKESVAKESKCEEKGFGSEESKRKKEDKDNVDDSRNSWNSNEVDAVCEKQCSDELAKCVNSINKTSSEIPDSSHSTSILSEPPDIRNWYFSYVYESPETIDCADKEIEREEDGFVNQHDIKAKEFNMHKFGQSRIIHEVAKHEEVESNGSLKFDSLFRDELENRSRKKGNQVPGGQSSSNQDNLCCERGQNLENKISINHNSSSTKDPEKTNLNGQDPPCREQQKQNFFQEADVVSCNSKQNSSNNGVISPTKLFSAKAIAQTEDVVAGELMCKSTCGSSDKENVGNGFVTTKKNRVKPNDENSFPKPPKVLSEYSRKKRETSSDGNDAMKRKVLSERTNLEIKHIEAIEVTGKWRCPQKSKPNTGPPLKQLRLERWVQRL